MRILIANRGEIARRIIGTARRLGHETVAAYADPDATAPFVTEATTAVRLGPVELSESYLSIDALLSAASLTGATAVHPGYGFLSENAGFARAVIEAGLVWIGPHPEVLDAMGSKIEARRIAEAAGVAIIPGFDESQDPDELAAAAERIGYPVLVKAAAGGGGKGIRIVESPDAFAAGLAEAMTESKRAFGDDAVIVERYITRPRHVEVQVVGDRHGNVVDLGTRECSVQRRYQKVLEEAPAPNLTDETRRGLRSAATDLARSVGYDSAGTVEFVVDDDTGEHYFLEMNTRLQVEHPVTEAVTGLDLVELMIRVAAGERLPIAQDDVSLVGHAFEARINAEDASAGFTPQTGTVTHLRVPAGVRWDSGIELGSSITPHYDPMVAKLVVAGPDRESARLRLAAALDSLIVGGLVTNTGFHRWLIDQEPVVAGRVTTRFLDETEFRVEPEGAASPTDEQAALDAARAWVAAHDRDRGPGPWEALRDRRLTPHTPARVVGLESLDGTRHEMVVAGPGAIDDAQSDPGAMRRVPVSVDRDRRSVAVVHAGQTRTYRVLSRTERWAPSAATGHGHAHAVVAPFPAVVTEVVVVAGDRVGAGDAVVVIEAMKMLHTLTAAGPGTVAEVRVAVGDQIETNQILATFESTVADESQEGTS